MSNLTITIDEEALKRARIRAIEQGTSVNAVLRDFLESYAGLRGEREAAVRDLIALAQPAPDEVGSDGRGMMCTNGVSDALLF